MLQVSKYDRVANQSLTVLSFCSLYSALNISCVINRDYASLDIRSYICMTEAYPLPMVHNHPNCNWKWFTIVCWTLTKVVEQKGSLNSGLGVFDLVPEWLWCIAELLGLLCTAQSLPPSCFHLGPRGPVLLSHRQLSPARCFIKAHWRTPQQKYHRAETGP